MTFCQPSAAESIPDRQWFISSLNLARAQAITQGAGVTVAIIDTGVDSSHQDLLGNVLPGLSVISTKDGEKHGDSQGHGTNMAGLVAAHRHNGEGALGMAPEAKVLPIVDTDPSSPLNSSQLAAAIQKATERHVDVISISQSVTGSSELTAVVERAQHEGAVVVAAAGNSPTDAIITAPARIQGVVAVGAVDQNSNHAQVSVTGPQLTICAPGVDIVSTDKGGGYSVGTGTSAATAIVAGVVALIRSKFPQLPASEVIHRLTATATDKGAPGRDPVYGYGIVNPVAALTATVPPERTSASPAAPATAAATGTPADDDTGPSSPIVVWTLIGTGLVCIVAVVLLVRRHGATAGRR